MGLRCRGLQLTLVLGYCGRCCSAGMATLTVPQIHWYSIVGSTQDQAKALVRRQAEENDGKTRRDPFLVAAPMQSAGRGTRGRAWQGLQGNVFLTLAVPFEVLPHPPTVTPLLVGTMVAEETAETLESLRSLAAAGGGGEPEASAGGSVTLKWPNDVLIDGKKVSGVLIETELPFLLIGVGINVVEAPVIPDSGADAGRAATAIVEQVANVDTEVALQLMASRYPVDLESDVASAAELEMGADGQVADAQVADAQDAVAEQLRAHVSRSLAVSISNRILERLYGVGMEELSHRIASAEDLAPSKPAAMDIIERARAWMDFNTTQIIRESRKEVLPLQLLDDGSLRVEDVETGEELTLVSDYLD